MRRFDVFWRRLAASFAFVLVFSSYALGERPLRAEERRLLYVAEPGIRNYLEYGGHGLLVFDIDHGHKFVKRIETAGLDEHGKPLNAKGICASAAMRRVYVSTTQTLSCLDLESEKLLWERGYEGGCDRMAISPDGSVIYLPSLEKEHWHVVDARNGDVISKIVVPKSGSHNTVYGLDGKHVYLAGLRTPMLTIADTSTHTAERAVGPFSASIRPFTVNGRQSLCFVNVNERLGFEVGDLKTGKVLHQVDVEGFEPGTPKRHGCPSHGIGLTPDEKELWVVDAVNKRVHIFDASVMPPKQRLSVLLRDEPGWVSFSIDGRFAYPSTGDVIETANHKVVTGLTDERGTAVQSEKLLEIDFDGSRPTRAGNQFGVGQVVSP
jgi:hypothetical protein